MPLPEMPKVELETVADRSQEPKGFLGITRTDLVVVRGDGSRSEVFRYDRVERRAVDAAVIVAHFVKDGIEHVYLRSAVRPPLVFREASPLPSGSMWEVPAGLIEPGETPAAAAARELEEELGFASTASAMNRLGPWTVPAPALIGELHHFFHVRVDPASAKTPAGDGSPLEEGARIVAVPLKDALAACADGEIRDAKTELALRRLADLRS